MLPQKKSQLRRNAWYRQQLLQLTPVSGTAVTPCETGRSSTTSHGQYQVSSDTSASSGSIMSSN
jgi:hypothetical protein